LTVPADYPALLRRLDQWQEAVRGRFPGIVPCRAGCAGCCHGPFDISVADALEVVRALDRLAPPDRLLVETASRRQLDLIRERAPGFGAPWDLGGLGEARFDDLAEALAAEPCPALDETGHCLIYEARPMICRMMGIGMRTGTGDIENACPIQDEFAEYRDLEPQPFDLTAWEVEEDRARRDAAEALFGDPRRSGYETTIAGAVLLAAG
jgi:Fe-S-cluster containining protein